MSGYPSQTRSFRSGGSIRSHSTSELLLEAKDQASSSREGLLRTTRQAAQMTNLGLFLSSERCVSARAAWRRLAATARWAIFIILESTNIFTRKEHLLITRKVLYALSKASSINKDIWSTLSIRTDLVWIKVKYDSCRCWQKVQILTIA